MTENTVCSYLVTLHQQLNQILHEVPVLLVEERRSETQVTHTAGTSNPDNDLGKIKTSQPAALSSPVNILLHVSGQVKVDDVLHVGDVQSSSCHGSRHDDRSLTGLEPPERLLSLPLATVSVNACHGETFAVEEIIQLVGALLGLHEDQGSAGLKT